MRSDAVKTGTAQAPHRSLFNALGYTEEERQRPLIGIVCSYNEIVPGHMNLDKIAEAVKMGVAMAGGTPIMFPAIAVCDGIAMGHVGMKYSLVTRDLIADSTECMALAHGFDGLVCIPNCDKNVPGLLMAAARINVPTVFVSGGPMMGKFLTKAQLERAVVTKTTSGILVLPAGGWHQRKEAVPVERMLRQARAACIQCAACTQLCPRYLLGHPLEPHRIMRRLPSGPPLAQLLEEPVVGAAQLCCECGVCEVYACPMGLQPRRVNALLKDALGKAGVRYPKGEGTFAPLPARRNRKVPTQRAAARAGVLAYYHTGLDKMEQYQPDSVTLLLDQQIGAPCQVVGQEGDQVTEGQLVARCPEGKLGADLHASITGTVVKAEGAIVIQERRG